MNNTNYLGNPNLKKANVPVDFDKAQIEDYIKCADDPIYFVKNFSIEFKSGLRYARVCSTNYSIKTSVTKFQNPAFMSQKFFLIALTLSNI